MNDKDCSAAACIEWSPKKTPQDTTQFDPKQSDPTQEEYAVLNGMECDSIRFDSTQLTKHKDHVGEMPRQAGLADGIVPVFPSCGPDSPP